MIKFNSKNHEIEYPPSPMDQFDLNLTSFKLSYASQAPSGPARLRWEHSKSSVSTTVMITGSNQPKIWFGGTFWQCLISSVSDKEQNLAKPNF